jgi:hypothetical protein
MGQHPFRLEGVTLAVTRERSERTGLDFTGSDELRCRIWPLEELAVFAPGRALDRTASRSAWPPVGRCAR